MNHVALVDLAYVAAGNGGDDGATRTAVPAIPRLVHMIWVGDAPRPAFFDRHLAAWRALMPDWTVRVWTNEDVCEAEFAPRVLELIRRAHKGAQKADIMRYHIVARYGGVYMDADVVPHRSLEPIVALGQPLVICHDFPLTWAYVAIGFFAAAPRHPVLARACALCHEVALNTDDIHHQTGPALFGRAVRDAPPANATETYPMLPLVCFYRNLKGNLAPNPDQPGGDWVDLAEDVPQRFGSHTYAKMW